MSKELDESIKLLREIRDNIKGLQDSYILRQPTLDPKKPYRLFGFFGGASLGVPFTLDPESELLLLDWGGETTFLYITILGVIMPDATLPYVGFVITVDDNPHILDWTIEEYYSLLGFTQIVPSYGGCTKYDIPNLTYVSATMWEWPINNKLKVSLQNWTDVPVTVDVFDIQMYSYGSVKNIKSSRFPYTV